ncbi:hypothetical protein [Streptomyces sp. NPDC090112]|uniref:hypothetical protein n=1 Tax=Streptomyces sp. NPDC090112 TaxID=3365949 RepID=UPI00380CA2E7
MLLRAVPGCCGLHCLHQGDQQGADERGASPAGDQRFRYSDFRLLRVVFSHEALHQDAQVNDNEELNEELIATTLHTACYGQLLLEQPRLAASRTKQS